LASKKNTISAKSPAKKKSLAGDSVSKGKPKSSKTKTVDTKVESGKALDDMVKNLMPEVMKSVEAVKPPDKLKVTLLPIDKREHDTPVPKPPVVFREPTRSENFTFSDEIKKKFMLPASLLVSKLNAKYHLDKKSVSTEEFIKMMQDEKIGFIMWNYHPNPPDLVVDADAMKLQTIDNNSNVEEHKEKDAIPLPAKPDTKSE
jgi:hypothetical protein